MRAQTRLTMPSFELVAALVLSAAALVSGLTDPGADTPDAGLFQIEGRIVRPDHDADPRWMTDARVIVTGAPTAAVGFVRADGTFVVSNLASGSYVVEVANTKYHIETVRVDISARGKVRARRLNHLQPAEVASVAYPLKLRALGRLQFFLKREKWRISDVLLSPMVLMMVLPVLLIVVLPKLMNDPETKKEMEQFSLPKYDMPELSEMMTSLFGGSAADKQKALKQKKKQN